MVQMEDGLVEIKVGCLIKLRAKHLSSYFYGTDVHCGTELRS
jgi:hypothetical protein